MPRLYVNNDSYPELREIRPGWPRHVTWWRAFRSAAGDPRFWLFGTVGLVLMGGAVLLLIGLPGGWRVDAAASFRSGGALGAMAFWGFLVVTWGGDLIRPHLRRTSPEARVACPRCGHLLVGQLSGTDDPVRCVECGVTAPRSVFEPPYPLPARFRALPTWLPLGRRDR